jgi:alkaline phosphatase D
MRKPSRRSFLRASVSALAATHLSCAHFHPFGIGVKRPQIDAGIQSGDVTAESAVVWSATNTGARMIVEWSTTESFRDARRVVGPDAVTRTGFTAKTELTDLPPDQRIFYRVTFENLDDFSLSQPAVGSFKTAPREPRDITFAWSGDTAGQGWGIDPARGGMPIYAAMTRLAPDFFIHSGDTIYADQPIKPEIVLPDGSVWRSTITEPKSKPAQNLEDFRGAYRYNLLDPAVRAFNAAVPMVVQWDDHETKNNWYPGQIITDAEYDLVKDMDVLAARSRQAFLEFQPIRAPKEDPTRIYRVYNYGPLLDVFVVDERSYRGRNSPNRQPTLDRAADFLGPPQLEWLKRALKQSSATWKVIASDMPISAVVKDGKTDFEAFANGEPGQPLGRELELANLLQFIKSNEVRNTVWITADVHFACNIHYHPDRAAFKDFDPFWEFISGPLHAGGFGPSQLDKTFGPEYRWKRTPKKSADGPGHGFAMFGQIHIDAKTKTMRVTQHGIDGAELSTQQIIPA